MRRGSRAKRMWRARRPKAGCGLARGFRWKRLLEDGTYGSIVELAAAEQINEAYVRRILRLALLAPAIVEGILDGRSVGVRLEGLRSELPADWEIQKAILRLASGR